MNTENLKIIRTAYIETLSSCLDTELVENTDWIQSITPSEKARWFNRVIFSNISDTDIESRIRNTLLTYEQNGSDCEWLVWPDTKPDNFSEALVSFGFVSAEVSLGLLMKTERHTQFESSPELDIEKISFENIDQYVDVMASGWDSREIDTKFAASRIRKSFSEDDFFWVKRDGVPIATGETQYVSLSGYLSGSSVLPEYRGCGAYRLLVKRRLEEMAKRGVEVASTIALSDTSAPILEKLGFEMAASIRYYSRTLVE